MTLPRPGCTLPRSNSALANANSANAKEPHMPVERHWDGEDALMQYQELLRAPGINAEVESGRLFRTMIERYAALAAQSTLQLALHAFDDSVRLRASRAIVDWKFRLMEADAAADPLTELVAKLSADADAVADNANTEPPFATADGNCTQAMHDADPSGFTDDFEPGDFAIDDFANPGGPVDAEVVQDAPAPVGRNPSDAPGAGAALVPVAVAVSRETTPRPDDAPERTRPGPGPGPGPKSNSGREAT